MIPKDNRVLITWQPDSSEQKQFSKTGAQMIVLYDVERGLDGGEMEVKYYLVLAIMIIFDWLR